MMQWLAVTIMRGRLIAALIVAGSVLLLPLVWLSGPALGLVTLRRGPAEGALVAAMAAAMLAAIAGGMGASAVGLVTTTLVYLWLPVLGAAWLLRATVSLATTLQILALVAAAGVVAFHLLYPDPQTFWEPRFAEVRELLGLAMAEPADWERFVSEVSPLMTAFAFTNGLAVVVCSLLLARWWQSLLYNPGGFRAEFHALVIGRALAGAAAAALLLGLIIGPGAVYDVGIVLSAVFMLQALAVVHCIGASRGWSGVWFVPLYIVMPFASRLLAVVGIADNFMDLRGRLAGPSGRAG